MEIENKNHDASYLGINHREWLSINVKINMSQKYITLLMTYFCVYNYDEWQAFAIIISFLIQMMSDSEHTLSKITEESYNTILDKEKLKTRSGSSIGVNKELKKEALSVSKKVTFAILILTIIDFIQKCFVCLLLYSSSHIDVYLLIIAVALSLLFVLDSVYSNFSNTFGNGQKRNIYLRYTGDLMNVTQKLYIVIIIFLENRNSIDLQLLFGLNILSITSFLFTSIGVSKTRLEEEDALNQYDIDI